MPDQFLGRGRSAIVLRSETASGRAVARKIFVGSRLADLVNVIVLGANNPYSWDRSAIEEAVCRRRIVNSLVAWWLPGKVRVAEPLESGWNGTHHANEISTELIDGHGPCLHHAYSADREWEYWDLRDNVMRPLQKHLIEAGLEGLAWQAGFGNPVAASNFLLTTDADGNPSWVWIDLESGVPAIFTSSPVALVRFYLSRAFKYGRPMFDDVDQDILESYIVGNETALKDALGDAAWHGLRHDVNRVRGIKGGWRTMGRLERNLTARHACRAITDEQLDHYRRHPMRWYGRECMRVLTSTATLIRHRVAALLIRERLRALLIGVGKFVVSPDFRTRISRDHVERRIEKWRQRRQLNATEARRLARYLHGDETSLYITDFGIHMAIKPLVKISVWFVLPALYGLGAIGETALLTGIVTGGAIGRTLYTLPRVVAATWRRASAPWIALIVGFAPVVGNIAFPLQLLYVGTVKDAPIAKFQIYDYAALVGSAVPIWGGQDSLVEHWCNHLGDILIRSRGPLGDQSSVPD